MKHTTIKISKLNLELLPVLLTILGTFILVSLGTWQLFRLNEKNNFLANLKSNLQQPAVEYQLIPSDKKNIHYHKLKLIGKFIAGKDMYLYGRKSGQQEKDGYYLISPFQTTNNQVILIARGWLSRSQKNLLDNLIIPNNLEEIIGVTLPSEKKATFVPQNDYKNKILFTLDIQNIAQFLNLPLENFYLMQTESSIPISILKPLSAHKLLKVRNDHLEYAITWFCLAICLVVICAVYHTKKLSKKNL